MWNFPQVNATTPRRWLINIGFGSSLVRSGNKAIIWADADADPSRHMAPLDHNDLRGIDVGEKSW